MGAKRTVGHVQGRAVPTDMTGVTPGNPYCSEHETTTCISIRATRYHTRGPLLLLCANSKGLKQHERPTSQKRK